MKSKRGIAFGKWANKVLKQYILQGYALNERLLSAQGKTDVFGAEKESGKAEGILAAVCQNVFGQEVYPSFEEKVANLLYFMIKDHPFADGCKRITATAVSGIHEQELYPS